MTNNSLQTIEKSLRSIAKRYKNIKYSIGLAVLFLMNGTNAFSDSNIIQEPEKQKDILTDVKKRKSKLKENKKVVQLAPKAKPSWVNMQFGANDIYSNYFTTAKTKVDKTSVVKSKKTILVASADNSVSLPMFTKLLSDIGETTENRTEVLASIANKENNPTETVAPTIEEIQTGKENLRNSVGNLQNKIDTAIGALRGLTQSDLIFGVEVTKYTTSKYIQLGQDIIEPYNDMIRTSGIEKWNIYSGSLTWMASITQLPDYTIRNAYLAKVPYTVWAGRISTPVDKKDTYNFLDGLEQRYGVEEIGTRENGVFQKLNSIGNNEEILFFQAIDEMMGHQYANIQQRVQATGNILDKEFNYLKTKWQTASKDSNKIKTFGTRGEYKTDTAGVIDYRNNAYGVAYVHEDETVKLGEGTGWYAGIVHNTFRFKDIGRSKEEQLQGKIGIFKSVPFDHNNSLNWTISGDIFAGYNKMNRRFLVVDEIFNAKGRYHTYGISLKNELSSTFRLSESFSLKPYVAAGLEYGRVSKIREKSGEIKLEVKSNDYFSIKPEIGAELDYKAYFGRKTLKVGVAVAYENELGRVANGKNKARVAGTDADWFNIRGEKEDRRGNVKSDLNIGWDNQRVGVTANIGYDTKGRNVRGGVGLRVIF